MSVVVPAGLVSAAIRAADQRGQDVADVPLTALAAAAGISRSTLLRRLGGSRRALDGAVRAAGIDPGGRPPVRERAVDAGAHLISRQGLAAATLEAVADAACCSLHSLHATFGGRDGLLVAIYERYSPFPDLERVTAPPASLHDTVSGVYQAMVTAFSREPRVFPALLADVFGRPDGPAGPVFARYLPRMLGSVGGWLTAEVRAGRLRPLPLPLLIQQLLGPLAVHLFLRPTLAAELDLDLPSIEESCAAFADAFLRAVAMPGGTGTPATGQRQPDRSAHPESEA